VPDEPGLPAGAGEKPEMLARLRAVVEARDTELERAGRGEGAPQCGAEEAEFLGAGAP